jgi:hypothetical protein
MGIQLLYYFTFASIVCQGPRFRNKRMQLS